MEYVLPIGGKETHFWPPQLIGACISDRIEDVKKERKNTNLCLVLSVGTLNTRDT